MQTYTIKARIRYTTTDETVNKAIFKLYQLLLPTESCSYNPENDSIMISYNYIDAIQIEEITS